MAGSRKAKHDIAPTMRMAFYQGMLKAAKKKNMTLSDYAATLWEDDWKAAINALAKFLPTEKKVTGHIAHDHQHTHVGVSETVTFIEAVIGSEAESPPEEHHQDGPVLPAPVRPQ